MKEIQLTRGKVALVDDEDYERLNQWKWLFSFSGYAARSENNKKSGKNYLIMHRVILFLEKGDGVFVDHINGNPLDNRRSNLRKCTQLENMQNQKLRSDSVSKLKGVSFESRKNRWHARISVNKKVKHIGYFINKYDAYNAYCKAALKYHGDFANFGNGCAILKDNDVSR